MRLFSQRALVILTEAGTASTQMLRIIARPPMHPNSLLADRVSAGYNPGMNSAPQPKPAGRPLPWALITFAALTLCSIAVLAILLTGGNLDEFRPGLSWTPTAPSDASAPASSPENRVFTSGDRVAIAYAGSVNLRRTPGFQNKPDDDTLRTLGQGTTGTITGGPVDVDGLRWWQVRFESGEGWMAEHTSQGRVLLALQSP